MICAGNRKSSPIWIFNKRQCEQLSQLFLEMYSEKTHTNLILCVSALCESMRCVSDFYVTMQQFQLSLSFQQLKFNYNAVICIFPLIVRNFFKKLESTWFNQDRLSSESSFGNCKHEARKEQSHLPNGFYPSVLSLVFFGIKLLKPVIMQCMVFQIVFGQHNQVHVWFPKALICF